MAFFTTKKSFFAAALSGDIGDLKDGIDAGYGINMKNEAGDTVTHIAARSGQTEALKFLLSRKPDLEALNNDGHTPLFTTTIGGRT